MMKIIQTGDYGELQFRNFFNIILCDYKDVIKNAANLVTLVDASKRLHKSISPHKIEHPMHWISCKLDCDLAMPFCADFYAVLPEDSDVEAKAQLLAFGLILEGNILIILLTKLFIKNINL